MPRPTSPGEPEANKENEGVRDDYRWCDQGSRPATREREGALPLSASPAPPLQPPSSDAPGPLHAPSHYNPIPLQTCPSGLPEAVWYLVAELLPQHDLARFAAVCSETRSVAESLMHRHPVIRDENSMTSWATALMREPKRVQLVQSLTVGWTVTEPVAKRPAMAFAIATKQLRAYNNLHTLNVFADAAQGCFGMTQVLPASIRTLNTSGAFFTQVRQPLPPLLHLSLRIGVYDLKCMMGPLSLLKDTLIQLRILMTWPSPMRKHADNPARLCARLCAPKLVYFEFREDRSEVRLIEHPHNTSIDTHRFALGHPLAFWVQHPLGPTARRHDLVEHARGADACPQVPDLEACVG